MSIKRRLILSLLRHYRIRGHLLACALCDNSFYMTISLHDIKIDEAVNCILIHLFWPDVLAAEQCNHARGLKPPIDAGQAVDLLMNWYDPRYWH